ncbi:MAG: hypothetical protein RIR26_2764 [Pseudomonadota bacterium]
MKRILIADASKASLVMTSEVFKDHFPGVQVVVARTSADALELAKTCGELDAFIIDYDLPDRDGAYTAGRLKKMFPQPILITAFDRPDVQENIDRELAAFDDCLSWLKKPVKPEIVVSLAQRFIEGQHRCQRRLNCSLPAFLEIEFSPAAQNSAIAKAVNVTRGMSAARVKVAVKKKKATPKKKEAPKKKESKKQSVVVKAKSVSKPKPKAPAKSKTTAQKKTPVAKTSTQAKKTVVQKNSAPVKKVQPVKVKETLSLKPVRRWVPVVIDDVSLAGAKIRVNNQEMVFSLGSKASKGPVQKYLCDFREGQILNVHVPPSAAVEAGAEALERWQKTQAKLLSGFTEVETVVAGSKKSNSVASKSSTLAGIQGRTRAGTAPASAASEPETEGASGLGLVMRGEVRWTASSETFTFCGLRSETVNVSKKLFESMVELESRANSKLSPVLSPNIPRAPKLNA